MELIERLNYSHINNKSLDIQFIQIDKQQKQFKDVYLTFSKFSDKVLVKLKKNDRTVKRIKLDKVITLGLKTA